MRFSAREKIYRQEVRQTANPYISPQDIKRLEPLPKNRPRFDLEPTPSIVAYALRKSAPDLQATALRRLPHFMRTRQRIRRHIA